MELPDSEDPKHGIRIGWSGDSSDLQLGKCPLESLLVSNEGKTHRPLLTRS